MRVLSPRLERLVRAVGGALLDPGGGVEPSRMEWFLKEVDDYLWAAGIKTRLALRIALLTVQYSPPFLLGRLRRFTGLSQADRIHALERYELSPLSILFAAIKTVMCIVYFEHPKTLLEANLDPRRVWPGVEQELGPLSAMIGDEEAAEPRRIPARASR